MRLLCVVVVVSASGCGAIPDELVQRCRGAAAQRPADLPPLNAALLDFSERHLGKQVGSGECAALPDEALRALGATPFDQLGPYEGNADYVWGTLVATIDPAHRAVTALLPGDVLQYRDMEDQVVLADGSTFDTRAARHTSVVAAVLADDSLLCLYEQNFGGRRTVGPGALSTPGLSRGTVWAYQPLAP